MTVALAPWKFYSPPVFTAILYFNILKKVPKDACILLCVLLKHGRIQLQFCWKYQTNVHINLKALGFT